MINCFIPGFGLLLYQFWQGGNKPKSAPEFSHDSKLQTGYEELKMFLFILPIFGFSQIWHIFPNFILRLSENDEKSKNFADC